MIREYAHALNYPGKLSFTVFIGSLWQSSISIIIPQFPCLAVGAHTCTAYSKWGLTKALWNGGQRSLAFELTTASGWNSFKSFVPAYPANRVSFDLPRYRKIPKISPGDYIFQRSFLRGLFLEGLIRRSLCTEGNLRFKIDWVSLILGRKFTVLLFFFN